MGFLRTLLGTTLTGFVTGALLWATCDSAHAQSNWTPTSGYDWNTAANWNNSSVPTSATTVTINRGGAQGAVVTTTNAVGSSLFLGTGGNSSTLTISGNGKLITTGSNIGHSGGASGTATVTGANALWQAGTVLVGNAGTGLIAISNGGTVSASNITLGNNSPSSGTITVDGAGSRLIYTGAATIGNSGTGILIITNGGVVSGTGATRVGYLGGSNGSTLTVNGIGSRLQTANNLSVGNASSGAVNVQNGGTASVTFFTLGTTLGGGSGTLLVSGTGSTISTTALSYVGERGDGTFTLAGGATATLNNLTLGNTAGSSGTVALSGSGTHMDTAALVVGNSGTGRMTIVNGASVSLTGVARLGGAAGGYGRLDMDNGRLEGPNINIGQINGSSGTLTMANGSFISTTDLTLGFGTTSSGTAVLSDSGTLLQSSGRVLVGGSGSATMTILNGAKVSASTLTVANFASSSGVVVVSGTGSTMTIAGNASIGTGGVGVLVLKDGGTLTAVNATIAASSGSSGTLIIGGEGAATTAGTVSASLVSFGSGAGAILFNHTSSTYIFLPGISGSGLVEARAGNTTLAGDLSGFTGTMLVNGGLLNYTYGTSSTLSMAMSGSGDLTVSNGSSTKLTGDSSGFTGTTTVTSNSTLSVNGVLGGNLSVNTGSTLKGSGIVASTTLASGATLAPGNSIGTLTVSGNLVLANGSVYEVEIDNAGNSDKTLVSGTATVTGASVLVSSTGTTGYSATTYTILTADGGVIGQFSGISGANLPYLLAQLQYTSNTVLLVLTNTVGNAAQSKNQHEVGRVLRDATIHGPIYNAMTALTSASDVRQALDSLSGEIHASIKTALMDDQLQLRAALLNRLGQPDGLWAETYGSWGQYDANTNAASASYAGSGVIFGYQAPLGSDDWRMGYAGAIGQTSQDVGGRASHAKSTNTSVAVYGGGPVDTHGTHLSLSSNLTWHRIGTERTITAGAQSAASDADYNAQSLQLAAELSHPLTLEGISGLAPFAGMNAIGLRRDGFEETSADFGVHGKSEFDTLLATTAGLRWNTPLLESKALRLNAMLGWQHLLDGAMPQSRMSLGETSSFSTEGIPLPRDSVVYELKLLHALGTAMNIQLGYSGQYGRGDYRQKAEAALRYSF